MKRSRKKPLTPLQQEYKKQVTRLKRAIARERRKGLDINITEFVNPSIKRITTHEIIRLASITPRKLRTKGVIKAGSLREELEEARSNVESLSLLLSQTDVSNPMYKAYYTMWEQGRARLDELEKRSLEAPLSDTSGLKAVSIAMETLVGEISEIGEVGDGLRDYLSNTLQAEVEAYGEEATIGNILALDPDFVETTRKVMKYGTQDRQARQIVRLVNAITGTSMSAEEIRELSDIIENTTPFE